jgi:hypothetical protein
MQFRLRDFHDVTFVNFAKRKTFGALLHLLVGVASRLWASWTTGVLLTPNSETRLPSLTARDYDTRKAVSHGPASTQLLAAMPVMPADFVHVSVLNR